MMVRSGHLWDRFREGNVVVLVFLMMVLVGRSTAQSTASGQAESSFIACDVGVGEAPLRVQCLRGFCNTTARACKCTSCKCYGLFTCTCERGAGGGCNAPCLREAAGTDCAVAGDGEGLAAGLMVLFVSFSLIGAPILIYLSCRVLDCVERRQRAAMAKKRLELHGRDEGDMAGQKL